MQRGVLEMLKEQDPELGKEVERLQPYIVSRAYRLTRQCRNNFETVEDFEQDFMVGMLITKKRNKERGIKKNLYMASVMGTYKNKIDKLVRDGGHEIGNSIEETKEVSDNNVFKTTEVNLDLYLLDKIWKVLRKLSEVQRGLALILFGMHSEFDKKVEEEKRRASVDGLKSNRASRTTFICEFLGITVEEYYSGVQRIQELILLS